jgi:hypothetical protein
MFYIYAGKQYGRIILKWILEMGWGRTGFICLRIGTSGELFSTRQ